VVGSLDYVALERLSGQEGHPASDLWSLGLVLYVAVEGYHPMRRDTSVATLAAVLKGEVPAPQHAGPLTTVLQALLVPDPDQRPRPDQVDRMLFQAVAAPDAVATPSVSVRVPADYTAPRSHRRTIVGGLVAAAVVIAVTVAVTVALRPDSAGVQAISSQPSEMSLPPGLPTPGVPVPEDAADLLTPDGVRQAIAALEKVSGGQEFNEATFYPSYVNAGAPVVGQPKIYDEFTYRDGVASRKGPGGELSEAATVQLRSIDWDILPALLRTAEAKLGITKPTLRYVIVDPAWTFNNDQPTVMVYLTDDYGGAYLAADVDGTVVRLYPRQR
jgi:hypothetical protein